MAEIKPTKNASRASDHDPMADVTCIFITQVTWSNLGNRSVIQRLRVNGNDSHLMHFIRAVDRRLNGDKTVAPKSPYKLRCSSRL